MKMYELIHKINENEKSEEMRKIKEVYYSNIEEKEDGMIIMCQEKYIYNIETENGKFNVGMIVCYNTN